MSPHPPPPTAFALAPSPVCCSLHAAGTTTRATRRTAAAAPTRGPAHDHGVDRPRRRCRRVELPDTITIGYQLIPNGDLIVKHEGWLEEAFGPDVTIEWKLFDSGGAVNEAIIADGIDIGLAGSSPVSRGISNGIEYQVPWIFDVIGDAEALVVRATPASPISPVSPARPSPRRSRRPRTTACWLRCRTPASTPTT